MLMLSALRRVHHPCRHRVWQRASIFSIHKQLPDLPYPHKLPHSTKDRATTSTTHLAPEQDAPVIEYTNQNNANDTHHAAFVEEAFTDEIDRIREEEFLVEDLTLLDFMKTKVEGRRPAFPCSTLASSDAVRGV